MSGFENINGALSVNKELGEGINEVPETKEIRNAEGIEYDESDLERIETVSDIMGEVFNDEVVSNWENLSVAEKTSYLDKYYKQAGETLGIDTKGVIVLDLYVLCNGPVEGFNGGDGWLAIDIRELNPANLDQLLNTVTHEMRHQLQSDALKNPEAFSDISDETLKQWDYEMKNYIDGRYDFEAYNNQAIEKDARAFATEVVCVYSSKA